MRPIKFRGKSLKNKKWVYGDLMRNVCATRIVRYKETDDQSGQRAEWGYIEVEDSTVGQSTGLKDENGKEIYEGDIIYGCYKYDALSADGAVIPDNDCLCKGVVRFSEARLQWVLDIFWAEYHIRRWLDEGDDTEIPLVHFEYESPEFNMSLLEVIGNIHDNPEMMKGDLK
ncbi:MAG: hypothetical protein K2G77_08695 [Muribaculaceae bacterium]|nr:hypothetical protein [Muribaculaceae bacterium]